jgi:hypothetical protein
LEYPSQPTAWCIRVLEIGKVQCKPTVYKRGWTLYKRSWTLYKRGWTLYKLGWTLYKLGWTLYKLGWTLHPTVKLCI